VIQISKGIFTPRNERELDLRRPRQNLLAQQRKENRTDIVRARDSKTCLLARRIKGWTAKQTVELGQDAVELRLEPHTCRSQLIASRSSHKKIVVEKRSQPLQRPACGRLAEKKPFCGRRDTQFLRKDSEGDKKIQVGLAKLLPTHKLYAYYACFTYCFSDIFIKEPTMSWRKEEHRWRLES
jgi:hypothetical protein